MDKYIVIFDIIGTIAFAISGALVAIEKKMDLLGVIILGIVTAVIRPLHFVIQEVL